MGSGGFPPPKDYLCGLFTDREMCAAPCGRVWRVCRYKVSTRPPPHINMSLVCLFVCVVHYMSCACVCVCVLISPPVRHTSGAAADGGCAQPAGDWRQPRGDQETPN